MRDIADRQPQLGDVRLLGRAAVQVPGDYGKALRLVHGDSFVNMIVSLRRLIDIHYNL